MDNVPVRVNAGAQSRPSGVPKQKHDTGHPRKKRNKWPFVIGGIVLLVLLGLLGWLVYSSSVAAQIKEDKHQAVFFTNGQVYFGDLDRLQGGYYKLDNIFYLQTNDDTNKDSANPQEAGSQDDSDVQLIKLGGEIHGPEDAMIFHKDQVLFFENLKSEGRVSESINSYQKR